MGGFGKTYTIDSNIIQGRHDLIMVKILRFNPHSIQISTKHLTAAIVKGYIKYSHCIASC